MLDKVSGIAACAVTATGVRMQPEHASQHLGARVTAEIGRLESLLLRVGAEISDGEGDEEDTAVQDTHTNADQTARSLQVSSTYAHSTAPRPCDPLGGRPSSGAVLPKRPRVARDGTEVGSPRQRVANVYTRAAASVSAECIAARGGDDECDGSSMTALLSRNIVDARRALAELERYNVQSSRTPIVHGLHRPLPKNNRVVRLDACREEKRDERSTRMLCRARASGLGQSDEDAYAASMFSSKRTPRGSLW